MKATACIPDPLFEAAEQAARRKAISRNELYAMAIREHLATQPNQAVTAWLNHVYPD